MDGEAAGNSVRDEREEKGGAVKERLSDMVLVDESGPLRDDSNKLGVGRRVREGVQKQHQT
jgi:hypothetical protein